MQPQIVRYFPFQDCLPGEEISLQRAHQLYSYRAVYFVAGMPSRSELWRREDTGAYQIAKVTYYGRRWPDPDLVSEHLTRYGACPAEIITPLDVASEHELAKKTIWGIDPLGNFMGSEQHFMDPQEHVVRIDRYDSNGRLIGRVIYGYDKKDNINEIVEEDGSGHEISRYHSED